MRFTRVLAPLVLCLALTASWHDVSAQSPSPAAPEGRRLNVPVDYYKLPNGLKVVLSRDTTTPTAVVAVYYNIGFRNEPKDRTGFAHLFEHMMFQGSAEPRQDGVHQARRVERRRAERVDALRLHQLLPGGAVARARDDPLGRGRPHARPRRSRRRT